MMSVFEEILKKRKKLTFTGDIQFWQGNDRPEFLTRTTTPYHRMTLETLNQRGISNRLLEALSYTLPSGCFIAGGFMTAVMSENKNASDIDLFFNGREAFEETIDRLLDPSDLDMEHEWALKGYQPDAVAKEILSSGNGLRDARFLKFVHPKHPPIQLIKLAWYDSAEHVIDSFDLTVAQFALDVKTNEVVYNPMSVLDLARKRLVMHRMQFPASTMRRIIKYANKGFYACPGSLATIAEAIKKVLSPEDQNFVYID